MLRFCKLRVIRLLLLAFLLPFLTAPRVYAQEIGYWVPPADARWTYQAATKDVPTDKNLSVAIVLLFSANEDQIKTLEMHGISTICAINVGYIDSTEPDYNQFRTSMIGKQVWSDSRRWIDVRNTGVRALMQARMSLAKQIGCRGVVLTNMELWYNDTGFYISYGDQLVYNRWLADQAHQLGLSVGMHNTYFQVTDLVGWYDFGMTENCLDSGDCEAYTPFMSAGKPVFDIEYNSMSNEVDICQASRKLGFNTIIKGYGDDTTFVDCRDHA